jgi:hypothetical protein
MMIRPFTLLVLVLPLVACGDSVSPPTVAAILVTPPGVVFETGTSIQLTAATVDAAGDTIAGTGVSWSSSDTTRAVITTGGLLTAIRPGIANVTASVGSIQTEVPVAVLAPVVTVIVVPDTLTLHIGNQDFLIVELSDSSGAPLFARFSTWSVSDSSVLRLTNLGPTSAGIQIDALAQGVAQVTVSSGTHVDTATVTVLP